jgi:tetratricopeptide (TPR) repeat protein
MASYSQDYVKRLIEELGQVWSQIVTQLREGKPEHAFATLDKAYRELANIDRDMVHKTSEDFLILSTMVGKVGDVDRTLALAELLKIEGALYAEQGDDENAVTCRSKALNLLCEAYLRLHHGSTSAHTELIDEIAVALKNADLSEPTEWRLFQMYERRGKYLEAEDTLHRLIDLNDGAIDHGIAFYERLLQLPDHVLNNGGLPRDEVQDGLDDLLDREA